MARLVEAGVISIQIHYATHMLSMDIFCPFHTGHYFLASCTKIPCMIQFYRLRSDKTYTSTIYMYYNLRNFACSF